MAAFMRHTDAAAELLACLPEVPANVDVILRQHHEQPDGKGFPKCLTYAQLSPLSCVFIVAHRMLNLEVGTDTKDQLLQFLGQLGPEYEKGTFGKIVNSIRLAVV